MKQFISIAQRLITFEFCSWQIRIELKMSAKKRTRKLRNTQVKKKEERTMIAVSYVLNQSDALLAKAWEKFRVAVWFTREFASDCATIERARNCWLKWDKADDPLLYTHTPTLCTDGSLDTLIFYFQNFFFCIIYHKTISEIIWYI